MLSQDQSKIIIQILNSLKYNPEDGKIISEIITELNKSVTDKTINIPLVLVSPENMNIIIEKKKK